MSPSKRSVFEYVTGGLFVVLITLGCLGSIKWYTLIVALLFGISNYNEGYSSALQNFNRDNEEDPC